jgi:sensor histidine kinase YesM
MNKNSRSSLIPPSLFKRNILSFLFLFVFSVMLTYSLSSIVYFTNLVAASGNSNKYEFGVIVQNILFATVTALAVWAFIKWFDYRIKNKVLKYILLFVFIEFLMFFASYYTYLYIWQDLGDYNVNGSPAINLGLQSALIPGFVGMIYLYFWKTSQRVNQKIDEQEVKLLQLQQNKTRAELAALEARINPHFLYNALNSIASLVHESPDTAEEMTMNLSALFRKTTGKNSETFCTLQEEVDMVKTYLAIEQVRFGERLHFEANIPAECKQYKVPTFIIQPLVENAIKHGISDLVTQGIIKINAQCEGDLLEISVEDNGSAFELGENSGYGLTSIQEKLRLLYGDKGKLSLENSPRKRIVLTFPTTPKTKAF